MKPGRLIPLLLFLVPVHADPPSVPVVKSILLAAELGATRTDLAPILHFDDEDYVVIEHRWLLDTFLPYFRTFLLHLHSGQVGGEGFDCDDVTLLFRAKLTLSNLRAGGSRKGEVPCGRLIVRQKTSFGGVPGGPRAVHALILIRTDAGWFIVEPQTGAITPFASYANLPNIVEVSF